MARDDDQVEQGGTGIDIAKVLPPVVIGAVLIVFFFANTESVRVNFLVTKTEAPLIVVLIVTALLGAVLGWFVRYLRRRG